MKINFLLKQLENHISYVAMKPIPGMNALSTINWYIVRA